MMSSEAARKMHITDVCRKENKALYWQGSCNVDDAALGTLCLPKSQYSRYMRVDKKSPGEVALVKMEISPAHPHFFCLTVSNLENLKG